MKESAVMPWVEISQAAFMMGISERTIRNWIKSGKLNAKTDNGRRLVEIPEEEYNGPSDGTDEPFGDSEGLGDDGASADDSSLSTQKRLEIALLECGRVKGTLSSQERIMETLSSNIAELTAKLQRSQNNTWKLVVLCVGLAFIALSAYLLSSAYYSQKLGDSNQKHYDEITALRTKSSNELLLASKETTDRVTSLQKEMQKAIFENTKAAKEEYARQLEGIKSSYQKMEVQYKDLLNKSETQVKDLSSKRETLRTQVLEITQQLQTLKDEKTQLQRKLDNQARQLEEMDRLKQQYRELESELIDERRKSRKARGS
jgi:outer membrane murein-binding lipoprotein Lpp